MDSHSLKSLLEGVRRSTISIEEAERVLRWTAPFEDAGGFATVDLHRRLRCGFPEVIFGQGKTPDQIAGIVETLRRHGQGCLATRLSPEASELLARRYPEGEANPIARTFRIP